MLSQPGVFKQLPEKEAIPNSPRILISACLLGDAVRYDGQASLYQHHLISAWLQNGQLIKLCPEVAAGLPIPRAPAEIDHGDGNAVLDGSCSVRLRNGQDLTASFIQGAKSALRLARQYDIQFALLKANSPSCGNEAIYDGSFTSTLKVGAGVTTALLQANGIQVFNETQLEPLRRALETFKQH